MKIKLYWLSSLALIAIMAIAFFFRFYKLDTIPSGLYPDVAINGMDAINSLETGDYKLFYPENNGREGLIVWLDAAAISIFGVSVFALKFPAAVIGTLTIWGIYLLAKQFFTQKKEAIALLAAFFCATSFWHVNFSRIGFRAIIVPFCLAFSFYFLWRAFKEKKIWASIVSGIFFGMGFYTYTVFRLAVPLLFCVLILWLIFCWQNKLQFFRIAAGMLAAAFLTALPIGLYFISHMADFFGRAGQTSIFSATNVLTAFAQSLALHLGMFNFYGDGNWRHNLPGFPELFLPVGILFLIGLWIAFAKSFKKPVNPDSMAYAVLLLWFVFLLLPGVLTIEGVPHALRVIGVIPAVMIISACGGVSIYVWLRSRFPKFALYLLGAATILSVLVFGYWQYFVLWAKNPNVAAEFNQNYVDIAGLASSFPQEYQTIILVNKNGVAVPFPEGIPMPAQTVMYAQIANCSQGRQFAARYRPYPPQIWIGAKQLAKFCQANITRSTYVKPDSLESIYLSGNAVIIPLRDDPEIFYQLNQIFPQGQIKIKNNIRYYEINK